MEPYWQFASATILITLLTVILFIPIYLNINFPLHALDIALFNVFAWTWVFMFMVLISGAWTLFYEPTERLQM
ncbi:MAG TPA: hypothetical protein VEG65_06885 [Candidatus Bathyarchaeia archaeon]|nr:hypothetical protein [Candidatus Bathyarchaeia archaeon]